MYKEFQSLEPFLTDEKTRGFSVEIVEVTCLASPWLIILNFPVTWGCLGDAFFRSSQCRDIVIDPLWKLGFDRKWEGDLRREGLMMRSSSCEKALKEVLKSSKVIKKRKRNFLCHQRNYGIMWTYFQATLTQLLCILWDGKLFLLVNTHFLEIYVISDMVQHEILSINHLYLIIYSLPLQ